jgi:hypothetical protein
MVPCIFDNLWPILFPIYSYSCTCIESNAAQKTKFLKRYRPYPYNISVKVFHENIWYMIQPIHDYHSIIMQCYFMHSVLLYAFICSALHAVAIIMLFSRVLPLCHQCAIRAKAFYSNRKISANTLCVVKSSSLKAFNMMFVNACWSTVVKCERPSVEFCKQYRYLVLNQIVAEVAN